MDSDRAELVAFYRRYLDRCNERRFDELDEFVDDDVRVNDTTVGREGYLAGLRAVVEAFPDYHWDLRRLLVDGNWLSARLTDTGTQAGTFRGIPATGRAISIQELAVYRVEHGKIVECWGDLGSAVRDELAWSVVEH